MFATYARRAAPAPCLWCAWLCLLLAIAAGAAAQPPPTATGHTELFLELVINKWPTQELVHTEWVEGDLMVQAAELKALGLDIPGVEKSFAINEVSGIDVVYEPNEQRLYIEVPPKMLRPQRLRQLLGSEEEPVETGTGAIVNYDVYATSSDQRRAVSVWNELRVFGSRGSLSSTGTYNPYTMSKLGEGDTGTGRYIRYDTQWVYSDPAQLFSARAGDVLTGSLSWTRALRLGGIQLARNFNLQPDMITYPLPEFVGNSTVPSSVELYVNNMRTYQSNVRPGPFTIEAAPYISGAASAQIVTTDALGRQTSTTVPLYISSDLLKKGLTDYAVTIGAVREEYGIDSFSYAGRPVADVSARHGLTGWLTIDGHVESTSGLQVVGAGSRVRVSDLGVFGGSVAQSSGAETQGGRQYSLSYSYFAQGGGINLQHIERSAGYSDVGSLYDSELLSASDQAVVALTLGRVGTMSAGYFSIKSPATTRERYASFSFSRSLVRGASMIVSYNTNLDKSGDSSLLLSVTFALGERRSLNGSVVRDSSGQNSTQWSAVQTPALGGGWGFGASAGTGENEYQQIDASWRGDYIGVSGGVFRSATDTTYWGDARGAVGVLDGSYFAANYVPDAFALVDTGEFADVPIRFANQSMGATNQHGLRVIPWLNAYIPNYIEIDPRDLPVDTDINLTARYVRPAYRAGVRVDFDIQHASAAMVTMIDEKGKALPPGVDVFIKGTMIKALTGWDGQVYFDNMPAGDVELESETATGRICRARTHYTPKPGTIPALGPLTCE